MNHSHHHSHDHKHHNCNHDHGKNQKHDSLNRALILGMILNLAFTFIEFTYGLISHSLSLIADAGHNLSDVLSLAIAFIATYLIKKNATSKFTYGYKASSILSALMNATLLFVATGAILWEATQRFSDHAVIQTTPMIVVAAIGIAVNFITAMFFHSHQHDDLNAKGAFLHLMGDAAVSLGVVIAGIAIKYTDLAIIDPIISILISLVIIKGTWNLFKESLFLTINAVPEKIEMDEIAIYLQSIPGVKSFHDLHVWALSTSENALTVHLAIPDFITNDSFLRKIEEELLLKFKIAHVTIQIENMSFESHKNGSCYHS
jgi:cobalt-zinc-cadmium efflux system protein